MARFFDLEGARVYYEGRERPWSHTVAMAVQDERGRFGKRMFRRAYADVYVQDGPAEWPAEAKD